MAKTVPVLLDRQRNIKCTLGTLIKFKKATGKQVMDLTDISQLDLEDLAVLTHLMLVWEDPELTLEQVEDMLGMDEMKRLADAFAEVMGQGPFDQTTTSGQPQSTISESPTSE